MPITTEFKSEEFFTTSVVILTEFISDYIQDLDITLKKPVLDENSVLDKPILYIDHIGGGQKEVGGGRSIGGGKKGQWQDIDLFLYWIVTDDVAKCKGGIYLVENHAETLKLSLLKYENLLKQAGLFKVRLGQLRAFPKETTQFYGGRQVLTYRVLVSW